jgi:restriction system protein
MNVQEAAVQILKRAGKALHVTEITKRILANGLWKTSGRTPHQSVAAQLYVSIKRSARKSPFVLAGPQIFALRSPHRSPPHEKEKKRGGKRATKVRKKTYSFTDSAEKVLDRFANKQPMHYRDITEKALEQDWLATEGKTPEASMYAQILTEIRRYQKSGRQPRFVQHGKGYVSLSRWMGQGLGFEIEQHNRKVRQVLRKRLLEMKWQEFEELIARLLAEMGFEDVEMSGRRSDGGIDVRGTLVVGDVIRTRMAVQVKRWNRNIQAPVVQQVRGSLGTQEQGLIVTTSDFGTGARQEATRSSAIPIALMNGEQLVAILVEHCIGVTRRSHDLIEMEDINMQWHPKDAAKASDRGE